jgi:hypothetical protein
MVHNIPNWKFVCWVCELSAQPPEWRKGKGTACQAVVGGSSLPSPPLLRLSREVSHAVQENRDNKTNHGNI